MGNISSNLGNYEKALEESREALRLGPDKGNNYANLGVAYQNLNRLEEAEAVYKQAEERKLDSEFLLMNRYVLGFCKGYVAQMERFASVADSNAQHGKTGCWPYNQTRKRGMGS